MQKDVSRKEFLILTGPAVVPVIGFGTLVTLLTGKSLEAHHAVSASGHEASAYAGSKR